jgi:MFS family permease
MFFTFAALFSWSLIFPTYLKDLGATDSEIGIIYTLFTLSLTFFQLLGGSLADRFGRKTLIVLPGFIFPPVLILLVFADNWVLATTWFIATNVIGALQFPAMSALLAESGVDRHRAFIWFEAALSFGGAMGPVIGALLLLQWDDMRILFGVSAVITLIAAMVSAIWLKETKHRKSSSHQRLKWQDITRPNLRWFLISGSFMALAFSISIMGPFLTLHLDEVLQQSDSDINLLFAAGWGVAAILSLFGEKLVARVGPKQILLWNALFHPLALLIWVSLGQSPWHIVPFILSFLFAQFILVGNHMMIAELTTPENRARIAGLFGTLTGVVRAAGPILAMQAKLNIAFWLPFGLAMVWGVLAFIALIRCNPRPPQEIKES